jgi:sugar O-acyltransferase (sialic acid O-acetyltransferase NeuD family)
MALDKLIIWGGGGHARVVADIARLQEFEIVGFLDDQNPGRAGENFAGGQILGGREQLPILEEQSVRKLLVAIGDCASRLQLSGFAIAAGFELATLVHPQAVVASDVILGVGTVIVAGSVINSGSCIGGCVIVNTMASIDHHCLIADGVHIAPGTHLGGHVSIGERTWIGIGCIIKDRVKIGRNCLIGAGALVLNDVPDNVVAYGSPARVVRDNI